MHIVCWKDGSLDVSRRVQRGSMQVITGHGKRLRRVLAKEAVADTSGRLWLLSVRAASSDLDKMYAVKAFQRHLEKVLAAYPCRRRKRQML